MNARRLVCMCMLPLAATFASDASLAVDESQVLKQLASLRGLQQQTDEKARERQNAKLDAVWQFLNENKAQALPLVRRELSAELSKGAPDQSFILMTSSFLISQNEPRDLAVKALARIDPDAPIHRGNHRALVAFTHELAKSGDPRVAAQIDRLFLSSERSLEFFEAPHYVKLPAQSIRAILYGTTGPSAEGHLAKLLDDPKLEKHHRTLLMLLVELGSEDSVEPVARIMNRRGDYEHFVVAVTMLMSVGGPKGRDAVIGVKTAHLDAKSRAYLEEILPHVRAVTFERLAESLKALDSESPMLNDAALSRRLEAYARTGVDNTLNPSNLTRSFLPKAELLRQLKRIRSKGMWRLNQHALEHADVASHIINAVQYRPESAGGA
jgi:hypothetical protein